MAAWMLHGGFVGEKAGDSDLSADFLNFGAGDFPFKIPFKKCFEIVVFSLWRRDPVLELQFLLSLCTRKLLCCHYAP